MTNVMHMGTEETAQPVTLADLLTTAGMSPADVEIWLPTQDGDSPYQQAAEILEWARAPFPNQTEAVKWYASLNVLEEALRWYSVGFTPEQTTKFGTYLVDRVYRHGVETEVALKQEAGWLNSRLPPAWILFFVECGVHEPAEGRKFYARAKTDPDEIIRLGLLRALM